MHTLVLINGVYHTNVAVCYKNTLYYFSILQYLPAIVTSIGILKYYCFTIFLFVMCFNTGLQLLVPTGGQFSCWKINYYCYTSLSVKLLYTPYMISLHIDFRFMFSLYWHKLHYMALTSSDHHGQDDMNNYISQYYSEPSSGEHQQDPALFCYTINVNVTPWNFKYHLHYVLVL